MTRPRHVGLIAGEASGDALGEALIEELQRRFPDIRFSGLGGARMIAAGMESLYDMERLSVMGFVEPLKRLPELLAMRRGLVRHFRRSRVELFIGIDSPDFNLGVASRLRSQGIRTVQYVSPSVWAWRQGRVKGIRRSVDLMLTLFPFESVFYERAGVPVVFVGHPLAMQLANPPGRVHCRTALGVEEGGSFVTLMPGSRRGEVEQMLPAFLHAARLMRKQNPGLRFLLPAANAKLYKFIAEALDDDGVELLRGQAREAIGAANAVLVASGTSTLEVMLMGRPMVVAYRLGRMTYQIARRLVRTPYIAIPNLLAGRGVVPEFIQHEVKPQKLADAILNLLGDSAAAGQQLREFSVLRDELAGDSASRAADAIAQLLTDAD